MKKIILATLAASALFMNTVTIAANTVVEPTKVKTCVGCHGEAGNSVVPTFPKLAGQHAGYIEKALKDFRDGFRKDAMMQGFSKGLSDAEIKEIAAYYAAQK